MITSTFAVRSVVERNVVYFRRDWIVFVAGLGEPLFWLLGVAVGLGELVEDGVELKYGSFVAPALIAVAAMNGSAYDATYNFFFKLNYLKLFDAMLATPLTIGAVVLGEVSWSVIRSTVYAMVFLVLAALMGFIGSWWAVLTIPVALLLGLAVAALGIWSTTYMRNWHDFDYLGIVMQLLFLCSATFFPLDVYPTWAQVIVWLTPLFHGVALCRDLAIGSVGPLDLIHVAYLVAMALVFGLSARNRLERRLLT